MGNNVKIKFIRKIKKPFLVRGWAVCLSLPASAKLETPRGSQKAAVMQRVGTTDITITYSRPSVNGREVWGELVPYGMNDLGFGTSKSAPWRAGANENTIISFTDDVSIEGKPVKAGTYGLHINVKDANNATIILSKDKDAWGSYFYEPENDALRADVKIKDAPHTEQLRYEFNDVKANSATASLDWEKKSIPFKIDVDVTNIVLNDIRNEFKGQKGFNRQNWEQAAQFALNNNGDLDEALQWIDAAIAGQFFSKQTFNNTSIKAGILNKMGKQAEALKLMDEFLPNASILEVHQYIVISSA